MYVGGLVGYNKGKIEKSYSTASTFASTNYVRVYVGGLVGYNAAGSITDCYATGTVTATAKSGTSKIPYAYAGGLAGCNSALITNCYSTSTVTATSTTAPLQSYITGTAYAYAGGLVSSNSGNLKNCFAVGNVTANSPKPSSYSSTSYAYGGGLVGKHGSGSITGCYRRSSQKVSVTASKSTTSTDGSTGFSSSASFYTGTLGWSSDVWSFDSSYPTLKI